jgi:hypothetical protein
LGSCHDERFARQRFEIGNQRVSSHELIQVDVDRHGQRRRAGWNIEHLTGENLPELLWILLQRYPGAAFEVNYFAAAAARSFEDHSGPGDGDGHRAASNRPATRVLRDA